MPKTPTRDRIVELRRVPAAELRANPRNWRRHPETQATALRSVLETVGYAGALLARETPEGLELIDGHLRREIADDAPLPVLVVDLDEDEAALMLATLDPLGAMAETDEQALFDLLQDVMVPDAGLAAALEELTGQAGPPAIGTDPDEVPPLPEKPSTVTGDLWVLGDHRLLCGDSFGAGNVARLLNGATADTLLTDPPFAIYGSSTGVASDVADDKMVRPFFEALGRTAMEHLAWFAHAYIHCDWRTYPGVFESMKRAGLSPKNCLVWDKGDFGLGANWPNAHEFIGFFAKLPAQQGMAQAKRGHSGQQRQVLNHGNILRFGRASGDDRQHNAAKPVDLLSLIIEKSTDTGGLVLDLFGGSGSTLIAAEKTGRRAALVEMEPAWCDVIVKRWETVSGGSAELAPVLDLVDPAG